MYLQALNDGFVVLEPGVEFLSVDNLPKVLNLSVFQVVYEHVFLITIRYVILCMIDTSNIPHVVHAKTTTTPVNP
jgi:hypothetical protein